MISGAAQSGYFSFLKQLGTGKDGEKQGGLATQSLGECGE